MAETSGPEPPYVPKVTPVTKRIKFGQVNFFTALYSVPENIEYKGSVLFVHGFAEYHELYLQIADELALQGYEAFYFDQRGTGYTSPGNLKGRTNEHYVFKDLNNFIELRLNAISSRENKKFYLFGHSMGGGIILNYLIHGKYRDQLSGVVLSAPCIDLSPVTRPSFFLRKLLSYVAKVFPNIKLDADMKVQNITAHEGWAKYLVDNPMSKSIGTLGLFEGMLSRGAKLMDPNYVKDQIKDVPMLIIHSRHDNINDFRGSEAFVKVSPANDVQLIELQNAKHSLFIDEDEVQKKVLVSIFDWLSKH